jgi:hypothetical protein
MAFRVNLGLLLWLAISVLCKAQTVTSISECSSVSIYYSWLSATCPDSTLNHERNSTVNLAGLISFDGYNLRVCVIRLMHDLLY